jgi:hypothetical protein
MRDGGAGKVNERLFDKIGDSRFWALAKRAI